MPTILTYNNNEIANFSDGTKILKCKDKRMRTDITVKVTSGGSGKAIQYSPVVGRVANTTSYTTTGASITVEKAGTYKCSWVHYAYASSSSYYLTRLYKGSTAIGSTHTSPAYSGTSDWVATENSLTFSAGDVISVRARARSGTSYWTVAGMLVIEEV